MPRSASVLRSTIIQTSTIMALALLPLFAIAASPAIAEVCGPGDVGDSDTSCEGLRHERNRVFAEAGYCFKSDRGLQAFGLACFPPYGELSHDEPLLRSGDQALSAATGLRQRLSPGVVGRANPLRPRVAIRPPAEPSPRGGAR